MRLLFVTFLVVTCFAEQSLADANETTANKLSLNECVKDSDCDCVLSPDHCGFLPVRKNRAKIKSELLKTENRHPACFGPKTYVIPKCQQSKCICQDRGKAPD